MARTAPWLPMNIKVKSTLSNIVGTDLLLINTKIVAFDSHVSDAAAHAHTTDNITGLTDTLASITTALATKTNKNGVTGSFTLIDTIDFDLKTVVYKVFTVVDGQIVSII
jgi:hypothetical protein